MEHKKNSPYIARITLKIVIVLVAFSAAKRSSADSSAKRGQFRTAVGAF